MEKKIVISTKLVRVERMPVVHIPMHCFPLASMKPNVQVIMITLETR